MNVRVATQICLVALATIVWFGTASAQAAELFMFEERGCPWCERWRREVGVAYPKTDEGKRAPLRVLDIGEARRIGIVLAAPVIASPTFVLVDRGREVGRIVGYPGADFFWGLLGELLAKLDRPAELGGARTAIASRDRTDVDRLARNNL